MESVQLEEIELEIPMVPETWKPLASFRDWREARKIPISVLKLEIDQQPAILIAKGGPRRHAGNRVIEDRISLKPTQSEVFECVAQTWGSQYHEVNSKEWLSEYENSKEIALLVMLVAN